MLQLSLDLLAICLDLSDVLLVVLGLLLLLNGRDDPPRSTASSDDVLVGNGEEIALIDGELTTKL